MTDEERRNYVDNYNKKYHNMTEEEKKEFLIKCRPYKKKYYYKTKEQNLNNYIVCV
jgi:gluconate kinase